MLLKYTMFQSTKDQTFTYSSAYLDVSLSRKLSLDFIQAASNNTATTFKIDVLSLTDVEVVLPPGFATGVPDINHISDLRIKFIKYNASPFIHKPEINRFIDSPLVVFEIMDANTKTLKFNVTQRLSRTGLFQTKIPYRKMKNYDPQFLRCKWYDFLTQEFKVDGCSLQIYDPTTCIDC